MTDCYQNALDQLEALGLVVRTLETDGKLHRVKTSDDKGAKKSGWYVAHEFTLDSGRTVISGRFGNWKASNESYNFDFDAKFTPEEKAAFAEKQKHQRQAAEKEKRDRNKQAAKRAATIWPKLPRDGHSPYLERKKIHGFGCKYGNNGSIAIPLYKAGDITGLQWIDADGAKKFLTGTEKAGAYFEIPGSLDHTVICEGYATGCSIAMATGWRVVVCFDAGNLVNYVNEYTHDNNWIIATDNDHTKENNKGLEVAADIVKSHPNITAIWPVGIQGTDFNDLHTEQGLQAVKKAFNRSEAQLFPPDQVKHQKKQTNNEPPTPPKPAAIDDYPVDNNWQTKLQRTDRGKVLPLSSNVELILMNDATWRNALAYCDFSYRIIKRKTPLDDMTAGEWEDADTARLAIWLSNAYGFEPARNKITDGIIVAAQRHRFHPVREYLWGLKWDGTSRLDTWLVDVYAATKSDPETTPPPESADYLTVVGAKFMIGAVARVMHPGCKMDNVMILEGRQGLRKSTSIAQLFADWFSDAPIPIGDKDAYQNIQGVWCSELAELDSFNKAESTSAKLFFSQVRDRYRPSYGQHAQDFPRQTIFVGTTNQGEYLKDYTGNRRYWPVKCNQVDIDQIKDNRNQYWAEALHRYTKGETWWPDDNSRGVFEAEQDQRMQVDPWQYRIEDYLIASTAEHHTADDIITVAIEKDAAQVTKADQNRISPIMKKLGYKNIKKRVQVGAKRLPRHVYVPAHPEVSAE